MRDISALRRIFLGAGASLVVLTLIACGADGTSSGDLPAADGGTLGADASTGSDAGSTASDAGSTTKSYPISVNVVGLTGTGLVLQDNGGDDLTVTPGASPQKVTFKTQVESGKPFAVTVKTQPTTPSQVCTVSGGTGTVVAGPVESVTVNCTTAYTIGGTVTGLAGTGLVLQDNAGDDLPVNMNGQFSFKTPVVDGGAYAVTVKQGANPTAPWQTCAVTSGSGKVAGANVTSVKVDCTTNTYTVGVKVTGLSGTGLVLQDNGADDLSVAANGNYTFTTPVASGAPYAVTVKTDPTSPWQTCTVANASDTMKGANVTLNVTCTTNKYDVGGTVSGMTGTGLVLSANGMNLGPINANGAFSVKLDSGTAYTFAIVTQPTNPAQTCTLVNPTGTVAGANVTSVFVLCDPKVLLVTAASSSYVADVKTKLLASGFTTVDLFDANQATPTLAQLTPYPSILVFSDMGFANPTALGDVVADYFDAGGYPVIATFANASVPVSGRWATGNYALIETTGQTQPNDQGNITIVDPASPLVANVATLTAQHAYQSTGGPINGGVVVAKWGLGGALIVSGVKNGHKYAELNMYPPSSTIRSDFWVGDGAAIMRNALLYR